MRTGRLGFLLLSLLGLACGKTTDNEPGGNAHPSGGIGPSVIGGDGGAPEAGGGGGRSSGQAGSGGASDKGGADGTGGTALGGETTGGKGAGGSGGLGEPDLSFVDLDGAPIYTRVQRLTNQQWENAVTDILRFKERRDLSARFASAPVSAAPFDNNERVLYVDPPKFSDFETGAEAAAAIATSSAAALAALYPGDDPPGFVRAFGRRAFRRPLTLEEETKYQSVFALGERLYGAGFANGAALVIRGMLESPHFVYRTELGSAGDPLNPYELVSKLSFWLLGTTPSDALLDAAGAGELASSDSLEATARQMLDDPRAVLSMRDFHAQFLHFQFFQNVSKFNVPEYTPALNAELALASSAFFDHVFQENLGLREMLTSKQAYVSPGLAPFYGLPAPAQGLELRDLGSSRSGYFMQVPYLMLWGRNTESDPIHRGLALEAALLCGPPRPPTALPPTTPALQPGETTRVRVSRLTASCGSACHSYIDPLGFAFENFDGMGRERASDNGVAVDTTGSYPFAEGVEAFADGNELMRVMADSAQVHTCYSKSVASYALGRDLVEGDRSLLESLANVSLSESLKEVVVALVRNPAFRVRKEAQP